MSTRSEACKFVSKKSEKNISFREKGTNKISTGFNLLSFVIVVQFDRETDVIGVRWNVMLSNLFFFNVISRCLSSHYIIT